MNSRLQRLTEARTPAPPTRVPPRRSAILKYSGTKKVSDLPGIFSPKMQDMSDWADYLYTFKNDPTAEREAHRIRILLSRWQDERDAEDFRYPY